MGGGCKVTSRLDEFERKTRQRAQVAMTKMVITGAATASTFTPIDTSNLINSQYKQITMDPARVYGRVGYTAEYARYVHDPDVKQTFTRSAARKEFLRLGFEEAEPILRSILKKEMRT